MAGYVEAFASLCATLRKFSPTSAFWIFLELFLR
jgi:hypothetical protein